MIKPPEKIYLQWHGDGEPDDLGEVSEHDVAWCKDKIFEYDIEYVRAARIAELEAEIESLRAEVAEVRKENASLRSMVIFRDSGVAKKTLDMQDKDRFEANLRAALNKEEK